MTELPRHVEDRLAHGLHAAAEVPAPRSGARAFVVVVPLFADSSTDAAKRPTVWQRIRGSLSRPAARPRPSRSVRGYEVRYVEHNANYTDRTWGLHYDRVLADPATRLRREIVGRTAELASALAPWVSGADLARLGDVVAVNSALVGSPIERALRRPERFPHLAR